MNLRIETYDKAMFNDLKIDCKQCAALCCVALYFTKSDGFPKDKKSGVPCNHLDKNFKCSQHKDLRSNGCKGCTVYECLGAGQKVTQIIYKGRDWKKEPQHAKEMFEVFLHVKEL